MYLPYFPGTVSPLSILTLPIMLDTSHFNLGISGVSGLFGGDEAVSAMATTLVYNGRRWMGWYNTPGSYQIAKQLGLIATSTLFKKSFPGTRTDFAKLFEFSGWKGPEFRAARSGTIMGHTGHLGSVVAKHCASKESKEVSRRRAGAGVGVSIVRLRENILKEIDLERHSIHLAFPAIIPVIASLATCIASALCKDWYAFSLILWGMLSNGISCLVIGSGTLRFTHPIPATGSPLGDGILGTEEGFVILLGDEGGVNSITRGKVFLEFPGESRGSYIACCFILFVIQFISQLFLIPQASLFGQIMFISSVAVSFFYNSWLASSDKVLIQEHVLREIVQQEPLKYALDTRTSAVVFALCLLLHNGRDTAENDTPEPHAAVNGQHNEPTGNSDGSAHSPSTSLNPSLLPPSPQSSADHRRVAKSILEAYLPRDTEVWVKWRDTLLDRLCTTGVLRFEGNHWAVPDFTDSQNLLFEGIGGDAEAAYDAYEDSVRFATQTSYNRAH